MKRFLVLVIVLAITAFGCADDNAVSGDEIEAIPFRSTAMLSEADLASLAPETRPGILAFSKAPASLAGIDRGRVLVAGLSPSTPKGLLRLVTGVERNGESLTLTTVHAPIQLAFRKVHVKMTRATGDLGSAARVPGDVAPRALRVTDGPPASRFGIAQSIAIDLALFDGDGDPETKDDRVDLHGELGGGIDFDLRFDFDWGNWEDLPEDVLGCVTNVLVVLSGGVQTCVLEKLLPEAKLSFDVRPHLEVSVQLTGAAMADFEKEVPVFTSVLPPIPIGPLVFVPNVDVIAKLEGGASARFTVGMHASTAARMGADVSTKNGPVFRAPVLEDPDFHVDGPEATLAAYAKAGIGARLNVLLYDLVGPYAGLSIYGEMNANIDEDPCWSLNVGADTDLGVKVTTPELPMVGGVTLFDWNAPKLELLNQVIASGHCSVPADPYPFPPGSGPDGDSLAHPRFTPWSRLVTSPGDGAAAVSPTDDDNSWTDLTRTIDGRFLVAGVGARTLFKLDDAGSLVWSRQYKVDDEPAKLLRATSALDATIVALTQTSAAPIALLKIGQAGGTYFHEAVTLDAPDCAPEPKLMARDSGSGFIVAGACADRAKMWILHVDAAGAVTRAQMLADPGGAPIVPTAMVRVDGDVVLAGTVTPAGGFAKMFAVRFSDAASPKFMATYSACVDAQDLSPTSGVPGRNGDITLAGSGGAHHNGFIARLHPDGSVAFASFPGFDFGLSRVFVINTIAELPTTGYVIAGSTVELTSEVASVRTPGVVLAMVDGVGRLLWANRYTLSTPTAPFTPAGVPGVRLTDDGGIYVTALAYDGTPNGRIWAMKTLAKDGSIPFDPTKAQSAPLPLQDLTCDLQSAAWSGVFSDVAATTRDLVTSATPTSLDLVSLTP